jgi:hypothetical protein
MFFLRYYLCGILLVCACFNQCVVNLSIFLVYWKEKKKTKEIIIFIPEALEACSSLSCDLLWTNSHGVPRAKSHSY